MSIVRWTPTPAWDPFSEMESMLEQFGGRGANSFVPPMNIYQTDEEVKVDVPLPGINPDDVKVSIENDVLTIQGSSQSKTEVDEANFYRHEIRTGSFYRSVALPTAVSGDKAEATYEDGVLKLNIPKEERAKPKSIKVKVKK
ncbi:MAG: Hsp20/alpha crystallin family protein [Candidatus Komeilibacteria bacterium]|nr:Hsp20/alpha crystallin family protein [Candidatus Komeilibacteria bacterium]